MFRALVVATILYCLIVPAYAHDDADWIERGQYTNPAKQYCCGPTDCKVVHAQHVTLPTIGFRVVETGEFVPEAEATPAPPEAGGNFWRCAWGGDRKCFFYPPPNT